MSQHSATPDNKNGKPEAVGVTAVLDSLVRKTEKRERESDRPIISQAQTTVDVRPATDQPVKEAPAPRPAPTPMTNASATELPEAPRRIAFSDYSDMGKPMWSVTAATALGLPNRFLEAFDDLADGDEAAWISTLVKLTQPMCQGAPDVPTMLVTADGTDLATAIGLPVHTTGSLPPYGGSIMCQIDNSEADFAWLDRVRGDRALHVVVDNASTNWLLRGQPAAVSYTSNSGALEAIKIAEETGATIAFGVNAEMVPIRATPLELALSVRSLFGLR